MSIENSVVFLPVKNIEETTKFYRDIVGLPLVQEQSGGICRIFDTGYGYWGFCQYPDDRKILSGPTGACLSLNCHDIFDVDKQYQIMIERGCKICNKPKKQENFPVYAFFTADPDDYKVEFQYIMLENQKLCGGQNNI